MTEVPEPGRRLGSTYRLQLAGLGFAGARALVGYLHQLGIETLYCSPILAAVPGSTHGYDVIDPTRLNPELGTDAEFSQLLDELDQHDMRLLIDIVPNHMATDFTNTWWSDVLRFGQDAATAAVFDIDWSVHDGRVLIPTLGQPLADTLTATHPTVDGSDGEAVLHLGGQAFPLDPADVPRDGPLAPGDALDLLAGQHYLPAYWRRAGDEGNYRRFFDIDGLVGIRVEDRDVFDLTHGRILDLMADDRVAGLRVDHIDGLTNPAGYLSWLSTASRAHRTTTPIVLVEKILATNETLPSDWVTQGTTGYEFADLAGGLFIDGVGTEPPFADLALAAKRQVLAASFGAPLDRLARLAAAALEHERPGHDLSLASLRAAIAELTVQLDVYRTYLGSGSVSDGDHRRVEAAESAASILVGGEARRALGAITAGLLGQRPAWDTFAQRWQQLTGAVTAKGVEDTATYRFDGLLGHAEVGSRPDRSSVRPVDFVAAMALRQQTHPDSLNTTSTHDSKRSEDLRARLYALSEWRAEWGTQVDHWFTQHANWLAGHGALDAQTSRVVYQTLVALWPTDHPVLDQDTTRRVQEYVVKVAREGKTHSNWSDPDERFESSLMAFVAHLASSSEHFGASAMEWANHLGPAAATTSLALSVLKATSPGVPDVYQGNEVWDFSLTDPDNRRPVDFALRQRLLDTLPQRDGPIADRQAALTDLLDQWPDGRIKLYVLRTLLELRRQHSDLFGRGEVVPIAVTGPLHDHVVAFGRRLDNRWLVAVLPRLLRRAGCEGAFPLGASTWKGTSLGLPPTAPRELTDVLTGAVLTAHQSDLPLEQVFRLLPVAVLTG